MYGYIYKTTNLLNGKIYIGQKKSAVFLGESYLGSGKYLVRAVNKYGKENFHVEMIDSAESRDELSQLEIRYISEYDATNHLKGYNIAKGGIGGGEVYVNNGERNEFIAKCSLQSYLSQGWQLGMMPGRKEVNHSLTRASNISKALTGRHKSQAHIENHRKSLVDAKRHWYTSGVVDDNIIVCEGGDIPEGYFRGRTLSDDFKKSCGVKNIGKSSWNKGLTKYTDERIKTYSEKLKNKHK